MSARWLCTTVLQGKLQSLSVCQGNTQEDGCAVAPADSLIKLVCIQQSCCAKHLFGESGLVDCKAEHTQSLSLGIQRRD